MRRCATSERAYLTRTFVPPISRGCGPARHLVISSCGSPSARGLPARLVILAP